MTTFHCHKVSKFIMSMKNFSYDKVTSVTVFDVTTCKRNSAAIFYAVRPYLSTVISHTVEFTDVSDDYVD